MKISIHKEATIDRTPRVEMLETMFEVPSSTKLSVNLEGELNLDQDWNIGLIVGPSGSGKTLLLENLFGKPQQLEWYHKSVIDDFHPQLSMEAITRVCQSVGFNTIPSWLRPYNVLSNGERFRAETARRLLTSNGMVLIDEFTSVVDRQVAQITANAVQKYIREYKKRLVAASCHYDIINWLQPDWILEPGRECKLTWRSLQRRPSINVSISRVKYEAWKLFRDFHYMSQELNKAARCYGLFVSVPEQSDRSLDEVLGHGHGEDGLPEQNVQTGSPNGGGGSQGLVSLGSESIGTSGLRSSRSQENASRPSDDKSIINTETSDTTEQPSQSRRFQNSYGNHGSTAVGHQCSTSGPEEIHRLQASKLDIPLRPDGLQEYNNRSKGNDGVFGGQRRMGGAGTTYRIASMCGVLHRPHPKVSDIVGFTRMVTLPDWQGIGLAFVLATKVASAYRALGKRLHSYPNHPAWIRSYQRSADWLQIKQAGEYSPKRGKTSTVGGFGDRRCAVFMYIGSPMNRSDAERLIGGFDD